MAEGERVALVLSGGGARGAYEVGVLSVLLPLLVERGEQPTIIVGTSVGAINAAFIAGQCHQSVDDALDAGLEAWCGLDKSEVIQPIVRKGAPLAAVRYVGEALSIPGAKLSGVLDPSPLASNLEEWIDWPALHENIRSGAIETLATVATATHT